MAQNKRNINPENVTNWLCSTGFLFPRNESELARFDKVFGEEDMGLTGKEIDPLMIIADNKIETVIKKFPTGLDVNQVSGLRMAARNGKGMPQHILDKIKKNQEKPGSDASK